MDERKQEDPRQPFPTSETPGKTASLPEGTLTAEEVFREYAPRVYSLARRMLSSDADAEDVTQDVLLQVVRKLPTFRGEASLSTWLHRVTVNAALMFRRRKAVREGQESHESLETAMEEERLSAPARRWSIRPEDAILDQETQVLIERAIADLPEDYRDVFLLADVEGLPNAEIADLLGLSLPALKSRLHRARMMLRNVLAPHFEEAST